MKEEMGGA
jgi:hypothetical protein